MATFYEWDVESIDSNGDIFDHHHVSSLKEALEAKKKFESGKERGDTFSIVLVRDSDSENGFRSWCYLQEDGKLREFFLDSFDNKVCKVPKRYLKEVENSLK